MVSFAAAYLKGFVRKEEGQDLVEYALLVALIAVVCIVAITFLGEEAEDSFSSTGSGIAG